MATWVRGIPLASAIIVRHTPNDRSDSSRANKGAIPCSLASDATDYIARDGKYAEKGDIDRSPTRDDVRLQDDYARRAADGQTLEYIARLGRFSGKGEGRQQDASLWNQYGPVDAKAAAREMAADGGAFIDSLIAVKREHAAALGLDTKEAMQRLVRATWTPAVMEWGMIRDPSDIRWVAAYHTDADRSVHVHIHTWSAKGEIREGATVGAEATRRGKELIYRHGYAAIRQERDERAAFLRDLSSCEARRQLGLDVPREKERALADRAERRGWPERLSEGPDLPAPAREKAASLIGKLDRELSEGRGSLARNWRAQATARDIEELLRRESPSYAAITREHGEWAQAKAAMKGYPEGSKGFQDIVRADQQERIKRVAGSIVRARAPRREPVLREDLRRLDMRGREGFSNISFSEKLKARLPDGREAARIPGGVGCVVIPEGSRAPINRGKGTLAAIERAASYELVRPDGASLGTIRGEDVVARFGEADMERIARYNPEIPAAEAERARAREQAAARAREEGRRRRAEEARRLDEAVASLGRGPARALNDFSLKHGVPLSDARQLGSDLSKLTSHVRGTGARTWSDLPKRDRELVDRVVERANASSPRLQETLGYVAKRTAEETGRDYSECFEEASRAAVELGRDAVVRRAEEGTYRNAPEEGRARSHAGLDGFADEIAGIVSSLVGGAAGAAARRRRAAAHPRPVPRDPGERER